MKTSKNKNTAARKNSTLAAYKKHYQIVLMLVPGIILLILFNYVPMAGILIAFKDYKFLHGIFGSEWVGMEHFSKLFAVDNFGHIIMNTLSISVYKLLIGFPAPIILALLLNELRLQKLKNVLQTCTYLPHFFSWVVLAGIFKMIFSNTGPVNSILMAAGVDKPLEFFSNGTLFRGMIIGTSVWQGLGWGAIVYLAALSGVDESLYEAAYIDGANRWKQTIHISIPCIIPTIITVFILNVGNVLNAGYDQIYNMYNPTVYETADIIETYVMRALTKMDYGVGTAAGLFKSVIGMILVLTANFISNKLSDDTLGIM
ncbi:MAG: sugar ABC transporter permease [Clostridia bacterium]|nr:sugar ABC transporter permease [Clostridia bacterium]